MQYVRVLCVCVLLGLTVTTVSARGSSGSHGQQRRHKPKPLGVYACSLTDQDGTIVKERQCEGGVPCSLGPMTLPGHDNDTLTAYFCHVTPTQQDPLPGVLRTSCLVETDESILHKRDCPLTSSCDLGPVQYNLDDATAYAYFCSRPENKESREDSKENNGEESSEERRPQEGHARRQRRHAGGRRGSMGLGRRGGFFRRPRSLMSYACNVTADNVVIRQGRCRGNIECSLGPVTIEGKNNQTLSMYFCDVEVTEERLLHGVVEAACLVETEEYILHESDCPWTSQCDVGPLEFELTNDTAYAYFCSKPEKHPSRKSSEEDRNRRRGRKGRYSSEETSSSEEEQPEEDGDTEGDIPEGNVPEGNIPDGNVPEGNVPEGNVPEGNVPEGNVPEGEAE